MKWTPPKVGEPCEDICEGTAHCDLHRAGATHLCRAEKPLSESCEYDFQCDGACDDGFGEAATPYACMQIPRH